jgi:DNA-directed RNA polymerase subunit F
VSALATAAMPPSWRHLVKVHPAADVFPMMSDDEIAELAKDIALSGLRHPIVLLAPERFRRRGRACVPPEQLQLLDGRNRFAAYARLASGPQKTASFAQIWDGAKVIYSDHLDPCEYVISANLRRRHLNGEQKRELIAKLLKSSPERSDRIIAKLVGSSPTTAGDVRHELEQAGDVSKLDMRVDSKGRKQPSARKSAAAPKPKRTAQRPTTPRAKQAPAQTRSIAISGFSKLLHVELVDTLGDLARILADEHQRIADLSPEKRAELSRSFKPFMAALSDP